METSHNNEIQLHNSPGADMQMIPIAQAQEWYRAFCEFTTSILRKGLDFGEIPGTNKPTLLKAGAEKLRFAYGLGVEMEMIDKTIDFDRPFVDFTYKCIVRSKAGQKLAECEGNCNSMETKFGFLWVSIQELPDGTDISRLKTKTSGKKMQEFDFSIEKAETSGQWGKPQEYWNKWNQAIQDGKARQIMKKTKNGREMPAWELDEQVTLYRIPNPDVMGLKNTIMKMAQKRAFVGAVLIATGASEFFTQDLEDMEINGHIYSEEKEADKGFEDAEVISETPGKGSAPAGISEADPVPAKIAGSWYAKLDKCKTPEDVDTLAVKNKETLQANPDLKLLFGQRKAKLRKELEHANG